jgi:deoxyribodipyrimidine photo-lyase
VYVVDELDAGGAARWWLHHSLGALDRALHEHGSSLVIRSGAHDRELGKLAGETGATALFFALRYEPAARRQQEKVHDALGNRLTIRPVEDGLLCRPDELRTQAGTPFRVFTPFWKAARAAGEPDPPRAMPPSIRFADHRAESLPLATLGLLPTTPDWAQGLRDAWTPGEQAALARLDAIEPIARKYGTARDRPDLDATSRLSPHLHFGELGIRTLWHDLRRLELQSGTSGGAQALLRQLYWRDFSRYLLFHFERLSGEPLRPEFERFPWGERDDWLRAWRTGTTGYPIVDAGMRQLWETGWMHNRVRMIVASFLVKHLLQPWQRGAEWFLDTLVDADLANNSVNWQWVAGCGTDAAPYFRVFNPTLQGRKFDPDGRYVDQWIPELRGLPAAHIHEPWNAPAKILESGGVRPGTTYPLPLVEHRTARQRALEAFRSIRKSQDANL